MRPALSICLALGLLTAANAAPPSPAPITAIPASAQLRGVRHEYQRLNNCGPVTIGMAMSYWGGAQNQYVIAPVLKPNKADKNVGPDELASYARKQGYMVHLGVAGDLKLVKRLVAAGFPVIVETWFVTGEEGGMGHYRLVTGFDDAAGELRALDSYYGPKVRMTYGDFQRLWRGFGNTYLVVAPKNRQAKLDVLLGQRASGQQMWKLALIQAQKEVSAQPKNAFAWFNLGTAKLRLGDARGAVRAYDRARAVPADQRLDPTRPASVSGGLPWRMQWYQFGPLEAYLRVGRNADVVQLANGVLRYAPDHEEALYWRGRALAAVGKLNAARGNYQAALRFRPGYARASAALKRL